MGRFKMVMAGEDGREIGRQFICRRNIPLESRDLNKDSAVCSFRFVCLENFYDNLNLRED